MTYDDLVNLDWETITPAELMNKLPVGIHVLDVMKVLVEHLGTLTRRVKALENEVADKILLEPGNVQNKD